MLNPIRCRNHCHYAPVRPNWCNYRWASIWPNRRGYRNCLAHQMDCCTFDDWTCLSFDYNFHQSRRWGDRTLSAADVGGFCLWKYQKKKERKKLVSFAFNHFILRAACSFWSESGNCQNENVWFGSKHSVDLNPNSGANLTIYLFYFKGEGALYWWFFFVRFINPSHSGGITRFGNDKKKQYSRSCSEHQHTDSRADNANQPASEKHMKPMNPVLSCH